MNLELNSKQVEFIHDQMDTNAINVILDNDVHFSIQTSVYLEENEQLNEPVIEFNDQGDSQSGGLERIRFGNDKILLIFKNSDLFLKKYHTVELNLNQRVDKKVVDFFSNYLFLGALISYEADFDESSKVVQTRHREFL